MGFRKQAVKVWVITLFVLVALALSAVAGAAQGHGSLPSASHNGSSGQVLAMVSSPEAAPVVAAAQSSPALAAKDNTVFLPLVARMKPVTTLPFAEGFGPAMSSHWTVYPFHGDDWRQDASLGIYWYNYDSEESDADDWWGLSMYLGPGSTLWADYEVEAIVKSAQAGSKKGGLNGLWIRGSYDPSGRVGGYYVHLKRRTDELNLWKINPGSTNLGNAQLVRAGLYPPGIGTGWYTLKVRVQGATIQAWLKERDQPDSAYQLMLNWTDPQASYMQGTVGLSAYKSRAVYDYISVNQITSSSQ